MMNPCSLACASCLASTYELYSHMYLTYLRHVFIVECRKVKDRKSQSMTCVRACCAQKLDGDGRTLLSKFSFAFLSICNFSFRAWKEMRCNAWNTMVPKPSFLFFPFPFFLFPVLVLVWRFGSLPACLPGSEDRYTYIRDRLMGRVKCVGDLT